MNLKVIATDKAPAAIGPYSQAIQAGELLFCSGQIPLDPATGEMVGDDVAGQARQVMANIRATLAAAGAEFDDVIKSTIFLVDMAYFTEVNEIYGSCFGSHKPARSTVAVKSLPRGALLEIEVIARVRA